MEQVHTQVVWNEADWDEGMLEVFRRMALAELRRQGLPEQLDEDWRQEMCLAVAKRMGEYQPERSTRRTFMIRLGRWHLQKLTREWRRRPLGSAAHPLDSTCFPDGDREEDMASNEYDRKVRKGGARDYRRALDLRLDVDATVARLPERLSRTYEYLKLFTPRETAEALGKSVDAVYDHIALIRRLFTEQGLLAA